MEAREAGLNETEQRNPRGTRRRRTQRAAYEAPEELHQDESDLTQNEQLAELSEDERFAIFESGVNQGVLPTLPKMPGYHVCWLTTVSLSDPIQRRLQLGYELIYDNMLPGWRGGTSYDGDGKPDPFPGVVRVREMVAARIRLSLYNRFMKHLHETMPLSDEEKLRANVDLMKDGLASHGSRFAEEGDGTANVINRARPMPDFVE